MIVAALLAALLLLPVPAVAPEDSSASHRLDEGRKLHDAGDYDAAIRLYESILRDEPDNPYTLYEMAFSRYAKGEYGRTISLVEQMLRGGKGDRAVAWMLLGNAHDGLKELKKAEKTFHQGLKEFPDHALLHYNLGINLAFQEKHEKAMEELIADLRLKPAHPGGWLALAATAKELRQRHRAFLAYARFLTVEPDSKRSTGAANQIWTLLFEGVRKRPEPNAEGKDQIDVQIDPRVSKQRFDPKGAIYMGMSMVAANRFIEEWKDKSDAEFFAWALGDVVAIVSELKAGERQDPFWDRCLLAYFEGARKEAHIEALAYDSRRSLGEPEALRWLNEHRDAVDQFRAWSKEWTAK